MKFSTRVILVIICSSLLLLISTLMFSNSLNNDSFIHLLQESYIEDYSGEENSFIGIKGDDLMTYDELLSPYGDIPVIWYKLEYQEYVCDSDDDCSWETYDVKKDSTAFEFTSNGETMFVNDGSGATVDISSYTINDRKGDFRVLQYIFEKESMIYVWGYVDNSNNMYVFEDREHNKNVLIFSQNLRKSFSDRINGVLWTQFGSAISLLLMIIFNYLILNSDGMKKYTCGVDNVKKVNTGYVGLNANFKIKK